ncbi:MAG: hypothetical protein GF350_01130 [Chitinivibrionales bacterium]|nr:hypothetical protein [Chitinivibrionales bacterium]
MTYSTGAHGAPVFGRFPQDACIMHATAFISRKYRILMTDMDNAGDKKNTGGTTLHYAKPLRAPQSNANTYPFYMVSVLFVKILNYLILFKGNAMDGVHLFGTAYMADLGPAENRRFLPAVEMTHPKLNERLEEKSRTAF